MQDWLDADFAWTERRLEANLDVGDPAIVSLLRQLGQEAQRPGFASEILCEAIGVQLAIHLHRFLAGISGDSSSGGLSSLRLRQIDERIEELAEVPTLSELARICGMSVRQLSRGFRQSRGISIGAYVAARRLEQAKHFLSRGESVKSVSYRLGFSSPSGFCHAFRKSTGLTPARFREQFAEHRRILLN